MAEKEMTPAERLWEKIKLNSFYEAYAANHFSMYDEETAKQIYLSEQSEPYENRSRQSWLDEMAVKLTGLQSFADLFEWGNYETVHQVVYAAMSQYHSHERKGSLHRGQLYRTRDVEAFALEMMLLANPDIKLEEAKETIKKHLK